MENALLQEVDVDLYSVNTQYGQLSATKKSPESPIKRHKVTTSCSYGGSNPRIRYVVCGKTMVVTQLS